MQPLFRKLNGEAVPLNRIELTNNNLTGTVPLQLGELTELQVVSIRDAAAG